MLDFNNQQNREDRDTPSYPYILLMDKNPHQMKLQQHTNWLGISSIKIACFDIWMYPHPTMEKDQQLNNHLRAHLEV